MESGVDAGTALLRAVPAICEKPQGDAPARARADVGTLHDFPQSECFPELDCVARWLPRATIAAARRRAAALGVGADRTLIAAGHMSEESYLRALAERLGVAFETLDQAARAYCPVNDETLV